jgi:serine/threonine-protein kinase
MPLSGSTGPERLFEAPALLVASSWSRDGQWLADLRSGGGPRQIFVRPMRGATPDDGEPRHFSPSTFSREGAEFSPDGRWLAYSSNESGANEVYVQAFPGPGEKRRISSNGGTNPAWSPSGRELFFLASIPGRGRR